MKKREKLIFVLLILAIVFSIASIVLNVSLVTNLNPYRINFQSIDGSGIKSSGNIGLNVLPQGGGGE